MSFVYEYPRRPLAITLMYISPSVIRSKADPQRLVHQSAQCTAAPGVIPRAQKAPLSIPLQR